MRNTFVLMTVAMLVAVTFPASAELQNVTVGGELRIRYNYYDVDDGNNVDFVEQRTRLNVKADFSDDVSALIELDSYDTYGEDFRSNYIIGADGRALSVDDVEVYQAYIQMSDAWDLPLCVRVGRQEMSLGSEWLVGVNDARSLFTGLSFDGISATYNADVLSVNLFYTQLAEIGALEEDGDVTFAGVYASYLGLEDIALDLYWLWVRDPRSPGPSIPFTDFEVNNLHTLGLRGAGTVGAMDFEAEAAYQLGDASQLGYPLNDDLEYDEWAANLELGYTFDMVATPRVYLGGAYFGGGDDDALPFNRLFSNVEYSEFIDATALSNVWLVTGGVDANLTESLMASLDLAYFEAEEEIGDGELGWELGLVLAYQYSEDVAIEVGYSHFFAEDGIEFVNGNGLIPLIQVDDDDLDYVYVETGIKF